MMLMMHLPCSLSLTSWFIYIILGIQAFTIHIGLIAFVCDKGASPFDSLMVGDVGDMAINMFDLPKAVEQIKGHTAKLIENGCKPLVMGGDHTISYPILQAMKVSRCTSIPNIIGSFQ